MPADQSDSKGGGAPSANKDGENITGPVLTFTIKDQHDFSDGVGDLLQGSALIDVMGMALDDLRDLYGLKPDTVRRIDSLRTLASVAHDRIEAGLGKIELGELALQRLRRAI